MISPTSSGIVRLQHAWVFRATNDIDVVADIGASLLPAFVHELDTHEALRVSSLEDILPAKLRWYRLGSESSAVQQRDVRQLTELIREELDVAYLRQLGAVLGVDDLLTSALA